MDFYIHPLISQKIMHLSSLKKFETQQNTITKASVLNLLISKN